MYKKPAVAFKPKKMIVNGISYDVDSADTLNKIRIDAENRKKENLIVIEEQKNQKILVRRVRTKNNDDAIIKEIKNADDLKTAHTLKERKMQQIKTRDRLYEENKKPQFSMTAKTGVRKPLNAPPLTICSIDMTPQIQPEVQVPTTQKSVGVTRRGNQTPLRKLGQTSIQEEQQEQIEVTINPIIEVNKTKTLNVMGRTGAKIKTLYGRGTLNADDQNELPDNLENESVESNNIVENNDGQYFSKIFDVVKSNWYILVLKTEIPSQGLIKIVDDCKQLVIPTVKITNDLFLFKKYDSYNEYRIYLQTLKSSRTMDIHIIGLAVKDIKLQQITFDVVSKGIDVWKFRKLHDLEFIDYYISKIKLDCTEKFIERFKADLELYKNQAYFDTYIKTLKFDRKNIKKRFTNDSTILYLAHSTIEYENNNYTLRSHYLLKNVNGSNDKYKIYGVSKYGYPYDKESNYYQDATPEELFDLDNVSYIKLLNKTDNINTVNILDYIKKYIYATIKLALETDAKIIHACSNYLNGLAAYYASKYLNLKCVYEVRNLWDDNIVLYRPEIKNSDLIKMMMQQEKKLLLSVDKVIVTGTTAKNRLIDDGIDENNIEIINNGVDTTLFSPNTDIKEALKLKHNMDSQDIIIGYIGTIALYEGIEYILKCLKKWDNEHIKFLLIGDGAHKNDITKYIQGNNLQKNVIQLGKLDHRDVIQYYNMIDIVAYPRKAKFDLCKSTCSYKLLEAMSMEKPIIVSRLDAYEECVTDNETGLFCNPDNVDDLFDKLTMLIENKELRNNLGKNAREWIIQNREWIDASQCLINIYDELLE